MKTVEDFVVGITADVVLVVDEPRMDVLPFDKLRQQRMFILQHDRTEALQLGFFLAVDIDLIIVFQPSANVGEQEFEVLVEHRLRRNGESDVVHALPLQRNIQIHVPESGQFREERPVLVHIGRIQPDHRILLQESKETDAALSLPAGDDVRIDVGLVHFVDGQLRVAVEGMDLLDLVPEESEPVGMVQGIGEDVDDRAADGILSRGRHEVHALESQLNQLVPQGVVGDFLAHLDRQERAGDLSLLGNRLVQGRRIGDDEQGTLAWIHHLADGGRSLDAEGRLVIAPFYGASAVREEENAVAFHQIIEVRAAIFGRFPVGKDHEVGSFFRNLGENEPSGRQKQSAAECLPIGIHPAAEQRCRIFTYQHSAPKGC